VWGSDEFAVFLDPDDQREPIAVVTIDRVDEKTRYRLWFADEVLTFETQKLRTDKTVGGVIAYPVGPPQPNPYGCLPFAFVPYRHQVRQFWVNAIGTFIRQSEKVLNGQVSELAESIQKYGRPICLFINVDPTYNPEIGPGRFLRLVRGGAAYEGDGFGQGGEPDAKYLQAELAIEAIWMHITSTMGQVAEAVDLPASALRLDYSDAPSGISIIVKNIPLLERARSRRPIFQRAETCLGRVILRVFGAFYGRPELVAAADTLKMLLAWPEPRIPVPGPERDQSDGWEIGLGVKSRIMVISERYGLTRDQAVEHLKQVAADETEAIAILPKPGPDGEDGGGGEPKPGE
jgi:Phage portal protein, SPP1 Gp6-like